MKNITKAALQKIMADAPGVSWKKLCEGDKMMIRVYGRS